MEMYLEDAIANEKISNDPDTQVGVVIIGNNFTINSANRSNLDTKMDSERFKRPLKYKYIEHAERNAIYSAANLGYSLHSSKMYLSKLFPCCDCARAIVESGIKELHCFEPDWNEEKYKEEFLISKEILESNNVKICFYEKKV